MEYRFRFRLLDLFDRCDSPDRSGHSHYPIESVSVPHLPESVAGQHCIVLMVAAFVFLILHAAVGGGWLPDRLNLD